MATDRQFSKACLVVGAGIKHVDDIVSEYWIAVVFDTLVVRVIPSIDFWEEPKAEVRLRNILRIVRRRVRSDLDLRVLACYYPAKTTFKRAMRSYVRLRRRYPECVS